MFAMDGHMEGEQVYPVLFHRHMEGEQFHKVSFIATMEAIQANHHLLRMKESLKGESLI